VVTPSLVRTDSSPLAPDAPLERLRGLGPHVAAKLGAVSMRTVGDLLRWFPRRHQEVTSVGAPTDAMVGQHVRIAGRVEDVRRSFLPGRRSHVAVTFVADDLTPFVVGFWNQPWLAKSFTKGLRRIVQGRLDKDGARFVVRGPKVLPTNAVDDGPCVVRYAEIDGVSEDRLRRFLAEALERVDAAALVPTLPPELAQIAGASVDPAAALQAMHRPRTVAEHEAARRYFAVHEVHALFTRLDAARARRGARRGPRVVVDAALLARIGQRIPFALTGDQQAAMR
jgi:ATP-dependent DNA helicase RecG